MIRWNSLSRTGTFTLFQLLTDALLELETQKVVSDFPKPEPWFLLREQSLVFMETIFKCHLLFLTDGRISAFGKELNRLLQVERVTVSKAAELLSW